MSEMIKTVVPLGTIGGLEEFVALVGTPVELDCVTTSPSWCRDVKQYLRLMGKCVLPGAPAKFRQGQESVDFMRQLCWTSCTGNGGERAFTDSVWKHYKAKMQSQSPRREHRRDAENACQ